MAADLTLYGTADADRTTFLEPHTTYVMTLTQNGQSTSLEFELPVYATDKIVTSVDTANNKITVGSAIRTGESWTLYNLNDDGQITDYDNATFNVAGKYDGNLGSLIGRTVNFQFDTDYNLTAFNLDEAEVVYGAMQYVNDTGAFKDGYYKDKITGKKYKNSVTATSSKNVTKAFDAKTGELLGWDDIDGVYYNAPAVDTYEYVKLVLNPDGTVSTAFILEELPISLFVTEVDGTKAIQDKNNGVDLDGYTIVKDDEYVTPADLEFGDVVFVNATDKFADVYNNEVTGKISNVISEKLDLDEKTYTWKNAQYYDDADDVYKALKTGDDDEASQNYLNSLDPDEDTTIWLNRKGEIAYIDGTETGVVNTTDVTYFIVDDAQTYTESLKDMIKVKVFDGSEKSDLVLNIADLKYYNGIAGKFEADPDAAWSTNDNADILFTGTTKHTEDIEDGDADNDVPALLPQGELFVVTYNDDYQAIGLKSHQSKALIIDGTADAGTLDNSNPLGAAKSPNLSKDTTMVTTVKNATTDKKWSVGSYTNLWIWNENTDQGANKDTYSMTKVTDFTNEIITTEHTNLEGIAYRANGTKATDLVVKIDNKNAYKTADSNYIYGMLTGSTKKNNSDNTTQVINTISIIGTDGVKATYDADGTLAPGDIAAKAGDYVELTQNKETEKISAVTVKGEWQYATTTVTEDPEIGYLLKTRAYDSEKLVLSDGKELTVAEGGVILKRYTEEGSVKHKVVTYSDVNTIKSNMKVWYDNTYLDSTGKKIQSAMIVVEAADTAIPAATLVLTPLTADKTTLTGTIGTVTVTTGATGLTYTLYSQAAGVTTPTAETATITNDNGDLKIGATFALHADTSYWVTAEVPTGSAFEDANSNVVESAAAVGTSISANKEFNLSGNTYTADYNLGAGSDGSWATAAPIIYDQYGDAFAGTSTFTSKTIADTADTTKTLTVETNDEGVVNIMSFDASLTTGQSAVFSDGQTAESTITITAS